MQGINFLQLHSNIIDFLMCKAHTSPTAGKPVHLRQVFVIFNYRDNGYKHHAGT